MSIPAIFLLTLSAIAGVVLLAPLASVRAASAVITLGTASGAVGTNVVVTGTGFAPGSAITITQTTTGTSQTTGQTTLSPGRSSLTLGASGAAGLVTDADGNFLARITITDAVGGAQTIAATDASSNTATATFTVTSALKFYTAASCASTASMSASGFVGQTTTAYFKATGFGKAETVSVTLNPPFTATTAVTGSTGSTSAATASSSGSATGSTACTSAGSLVVATEPGGAYKVTATGATSSDSATYTFTVNPALAFYTLQTSTTVFAINPAQFSTFYLEGFGFTTGTIAASSMTVGGVTIGNPAITVDSSGTLGGGAGTHVPITLSSALTGLGSTTVGLQGSTFSFANGNIVCPADSSTECSDAEIYLSGLSAALSPGGPILTGWGAPLVLTAQTSNPTLSMYSYSLKPASDAAVVFGYGGVQVAPTSANGITFATSSTETPSTTASKDGANWAVGYSGTCTTTACSIPDLPGYSTTGALISYTISVTSPASTTFTATPWVTSSSGATADYTSTLTPTVHGFSTADAVTIAIGGSTLGTITASAMTTAGTGSSALITSQCIFSNCQVPDLASGSYIITAAGSVSGYTATGTYSISYKPAVQLAGGGSAICGGTGGSCASPTTTPVQTDLTITSGGAGTITILRTGTGTGVVGATSGTGAYGVHGLAASTSYQLTWGIGSGATVLATFTSNAAGGISGGGIQFSVASGTTGYHILDLRLASTGADVLFGGTNAGTGAFSSQGWVSLNACTSTGQYCGYFGDLIFSLTASISVSPSVGSVGSTVTLSGSGLSPATVYSAHVVATSASSNGITYSTSGTYQSTFTTSSTGAIPSGTTFAFPTVPAAAGAENASTYYVYVDTSSTGTTNVGTFVLEASASLSASSTTAGSSVTITGSGLDAGQTYNVVFNKAVLAGFTANSAGVGSASFTVPSTTAAGAYTVYLKRTYSSTTAGALVSPPTLTVSSSAVSLSTSTMTISGTAAESVVNGQPVITATFTNTASSSLSVWMWVNVLTSSGASSGYVYLGSATMAAGQSVSIGATMLNLPHGTYTAQVFVTTTTGIAVSTTSTTASFTV